LNDRRSERTMATHKIPSGDALTSLPVNIVHAIISARPTRLLVDTGASISVLTGDVFRRIRKNSYTIKPKTTYDTLLAADSSPMPVNAEITADVKIAGLNIPYAYSVGENLGFEAVLGMVFLTGAHAVVDIKSSTVTLHQPYFSTTSSRLRPYTGVNNQRHKNSTAFRSSFKRNGEHKKTKRHVYVGKFAVRPL
jgi:outer membrane protein W